MAVVLGSMMALSAHQTLSPTVWDGVYTAVQAKRGEVLYEQHCSNCHGADLEGRRAIDDQEPRKTRIPPLVGTTFIAGWSGMPVGALFERDRISMPQQAPGSLSRQQNADILAFLFSKNGFPVGEVDLPNEAQKLNLISIVAVRP